MLNSRLLKYLLWIAGVVLSLALLQIFGVLPAIRARALAMTAPVLGPAYALGHSAQGLFRNSADVQTLQAEHTRLTEENLLLKQQLSTHQSTLEENQSLRLLLDFFDESSSSPKRVISRVIGRDPDDAAVLLLNVGAREGVTVGHGVVAQEGILVAKIIEVFSGTSKALLLTDPASRVAVTVSGGAPGNKLAIGERGLSIVLDQVPQQEIVHQGQLVITSGLEQDIPRGLLVGEIEATISEPNDLFQKAVLKPLVDYSTLYLVAIVLTQADPL